MSGAYDLAWIFTVIRSSQNVELTGNHCVISDTLFWGCIFDSDIIGEKNPSLIITKMQIIIKTANSTECLWSAKCCSKHVCVYMCKLCIYVCNYSFNTHYGYCSSHIVQEIVLYPKVPKISFIFFWKLIVLSFTFSSIILWELIFTYGMS